MQAGDLEHPVQDPVDGLGPVALALAVGSDADTDGDAAVVRVPLDPALATGLCILLAWQCGEHLGALACGHAATCLRIVWPGLRCRGLEMRAVLMVVVGR